ncbi:MAG: hypothetical protein KAH32_04460 [Chlamydiia bacterium]|nr:hypothetical protein [Chlamydiia bacterium]
MEENALIGVELKKLHYLVIEADTETSAFSIFKNRLAEKDIVVSEYTNIDSLIAKNEARKDDIVNTFLLNNKYAVEPVVWGGLYALAKENTLIKKFTEKNVVQNGTKKWETRYVLVGEKTGTRYDVTQTTKGNAVEAAKAHVLAAKEDISVQVEKVLTSHNPTVSKIEYIVDETEHNNIYIFMCNAVIFDEESFGKLYEENTEMDPDTGQFKIKVETVLEYNKKVIL